MSISSIGVQIITPKTGTSPQSRPQQQANDRETVQPVTEQSAPPPPPGMGQHVDKLA